MLYPTSRVGTLIPIGFFLLPVRLPAWVLIVFWFALQLINGVTLPASRAVDVGGVAYWAHVGGFVTGGILVWLLRHPERVSRMQAFHASGP